MKTSTGLVKYAQAQVGKEYWYGTYGSAASKKYYEAKKKQYPSYYKWAYKDKWEGMKVHDCVGLIKGYLWSDGPTDTSPKYNKEQDTSANGMRSRCQVKGDIATIPEVPGLLVFFDGHVGIYEGNGVVIEARGHSFGVVRTKIKARPWKTWGYCPYITYLDKEQPEEKQEETAKRPTVKQWQVAAIADGFKFPDYGPDGLWGRECEAVAKKAIVKKRLVYKYPNLTKLLQEYLGVAVDGKCGKKTAAAIAAYQQKQGLKADGECGLMTWRSILV